VIQTTLGGDNVFFFHCLVDLLQAIALSVFFKIESPLYLYLNEQEPEAKEIVNKMVLPQYIDEELLKSQFMLERKDNEKDFSSLKAIL
jgi:hypothetical protein